MTALRGPRHERERAQAGEQLVFHVLGEDGGAFVAAGAKVLVLLPVTFRLLLAFDVLEHLHCLDCPEEVKEAVGVLVKEARDLHDA